MTIDQLRALIDLHWPAALAGDRAAQRVVMRALDCQSRMLGLR